MKPRMLIIAGICLILGGVVGFFIGFDIGYEQVNKDIKNFEDCVRAGYPVQESFPEVCRTPDGKNFSNPLTYPVAE